MGRGSSKIQVKTYALFHGSPSTDIEEFDINRAGQNTSSGEKFLFFTDSEKQADDFSYERLPSYSMIYDTRGKKGTVYEVDVTMKNPLDFTNLSDKDIKNILKMKRDYVEMDEDMVKLYSKYNNQQFKASIEINDIPKYGYDGFIAKMDINGQTEDREYAVVDSKQVKIKKKR